MKLLRIGDHILNMDRVDYVVGDDQEIGIYFDGHRETPALTFRGAQAAEFYKWVKAGVDNWAPPDRTPRSRSKL